MAARTCTHTWHWPGPPSHGARDDAPALRLWPLAPRFSFTGTQARARAPLRPVFGRSLHTARAAGSTQRPGVCLLLGIRLSPLAQCSDGASTLRALRRPPSIPTEVRAVGTRCTAPDAQLGSGPGRTSGCAARAPCQSFEGIRPLLAGAGASPGPRGRIRRCRQRQQVSAPAALRMGMTGFNSPGQPHTHLRTRSSGGL